MEIEPLPLIIPSRTIILFRFFSLPFSLPPLSFLPSRRRILTGALGDQPDQRGGFFGLRHFEGGGFGEAPRLRRRRRNLQLAVGNRASRHQPPGNAAF